MNLENGIRDLKNNKMAKSAFKILLGVTIFVVVSIIVLIIVVAILFFMFKDQIYDFLVTITNFVFGDNPDNLVREYFKKIINDYLNELRNLV